jgi:hypothetical protein
MSNIVLNIAYYFVLFEGMLMNTSINKIWNQIDNYQHHIYMLKLNENNLNTKTSLNDHMLTIFNYDKIFQVWTS